MHLYCITMHFFFFLTVLQFWGGRFKKKKKNFSKLLSESVIYMEMNGNWCLSLKTAKKIYTSLCCSVWSEALKNLEYNFNEKEGGGGIKWRLKMKKDPIIPEETLFLIKAIHPLHFTIRRKQNEYTYTKCMVISYCRTALKKCLLTDSVLNHNRLV